ncbi:MAG TPA: hypothetical protein VNC12_00305 [Solirubrobacteraceae bacterium]|nr:hypothetical protein [Solirubrobacteraceae bacterium]
MGTRTCAALVAATAALAVAPAIALAAAPKPNTGSPSLWATIDVCDSAAHPDTIGIRGSMPGTADAHELMYMSFRVEYRTAPGHWRYLGGAGASGFVRVGNGASLTRQAGQDFQVVPRVSGSYLLRGVAVFEWRLHGRTIASAVRGTRAGHIAAAGADPPGFSATTCRIQAKRRGSLVITPVTPSAASRAISARSSTVHA